MIPTPVLLVLAVLFWLRTVAEDSSADAEEVADHDAIDELKRSIFGLSADEISTRFGEIKARSTTPPRQDKIDHFVVLMMENHATDHFLGCMDLPGLDGIRGGHSFPIDPADPTKGVVNVTCGTSPYVCSGAPGYQVGWPRIERATLPTHCRLLPLN